jgi:TATA-box binding protein (TBP) (component of TFIID and TFIIIB)
MFQGVLFDETLFPVSPIQYTTAEQERAFQIPQLVNVVATFKITIKSPLVKLPLLPLSMAFSSGQLERLKFSSMITRIKDGDKIFTCLLFSSGKAVIVKCLSPYHSLNEAQKVRLLLNEIEVVSSSSWGPRGADDETLRLEKLGGRLEFLDWQIQNFVLSANLGFRIKLEELAAVAPHRVKYEPTKFPGAEISILVKPKSQCKCSKTRKCGCTVTLLVFEGGAVIIGGSKTVPQGNSVYYRFLPVAKEFENTGIEYEKKDRYKTRIKKFQELLQDLDEIQNPAPGDDAPRRPQEVLLDRDEEEEALRVAIHDAMEMLKISCTQFKFERNIDTTSTKLSPNLLLEACRRNQLHNVKYMLECRMHSQEHFEETLETMRREMTETDPILQVLLAAAAASTAAAASNKRIKLEK